MSAGGTDQRVQWLRATEDKLERARALLHAREAQVEALTRSERVSRAGQAAVASAEALRSSVEGIESMLMGARYELGVGPEPIGCPHTRRAPGGRERVRCSLPWGHAGLHAHQGIIRVRWE